MSHVVTGFSQDGDVTALRAALTQAGLATEPLRVVGPDEATSLITDDATGSGLAGRGSSGAGIMTGGGGTGVPGLTNESPVPRNFSHDAVPDAIAEIGIPSSEVENYLEALDRGRSIVAYAASAETAEHVTELFRAASLVNVRVF